MTSFNQSECIISEQSWQSSLKYLNDSASCDLKRPGSSPVHNRLTFLHRPHHCPPTASRATFLAVQSSVQNRYEKTVFYILFPIDYGTCFVRLVLPLSSKVHHLMIQICVGSDLIRKEVNYSTKIIGNVIKRCANFNKKPHFRGQTYRGKCFRSINYDQKTLVRTTYRVLKWPQSVYRSLHVLICLKHSIDCSFQLIILNRYKRVLVSI